jgi:hypothetical protein
MAHAVGAAAGGTEARAALEALEADERAPILAVADQLSAINEPEAFMAALASDDAIAELAARYATSLAPKRSPAHF